MKNFNRIEAELSPAIFKENSMEIQTIYKTSLEELSEFKKLLNDIKDLNVAFAKFFETYPYRTLYRILI